jgi:selenocysteine lyase/cysteine desulfurase
VTGHHANDVSAALRARGINTHTALREFAVLDMTAKGAESAVRISPHYYNTVEEIGRLVVGLEEVLG